MDFGGQDFGGEDVRRAAPAASPSDGVTDEVVSPDVVTADDGPLGPTAAPFVAPDTRPGEQAESYWARRGRPAAARVATQPPSSVDPLAPSPHWAAPPPPPPPETWSAGVPPVPPPFPGLPPAPPPSNRAPWAVVAVIAAVVLGAAVTVVLVSRLMPSGSSRSGSSRASGAATAHTSHAADPAVSMATLEGLEPQISDLGGPWTDLGGEQAPPPATRGPSRAAPPACQAPAQLFAGYDLVDHDFAYNVDTRGMEGGHLTTVAAHTSDAAGMGNLMNLVRSAGYSSCAQQTAELDLRSRRDGVQGATTGAQKIPLEMRAPGVAWRATVDYPTTATGHETSMMDVVYVAAGRFAVVMRFSVCSCQNVPLGAPTLLPGEDAAVLAVSARLASLAGSAAVTDPSRSSALAPAAPTSSTSSPFVRDVNPCTLLTADEVTGVMGSIRESARIQVGDGGDECDWHGNDKPNVSIQTGRTVAQFQSRYRTTDHDLPGLGDQAAISSSFAGTVLVRQGNTWIQVWVQGTSDDHGRAIALARAALARV